MMEIKATQTKETSDASKTDAKGYPHTRIRLPIFKENEDLETWLDLFELVCTMENLDRKY